ncbi:MAG: GNAT family N-acetyltransferase [Sedimentisphaerales bacterium]|nr:GNAT family N-acetyltransferase [Sedimentisphaerales bacterium]
MTKEDYEYLKDHSASRGIFKNTPEKVDYSYSLEHEGTLLGSGGFQLINTTTAWCWLDLTIHAKNYMTEVYRLIKEWIEIFVKDKEVKRLQAYVDPEFPEAIKTVEHLGFKYECDMELFYGDRNAYLYKRLI